METAYQWKINKYPVTAQVAGVEMEKIRIKSGKEFLDAADLLDASRNETAPLHGCFDWNDDSAAEKYRLYQAKDMIRNIIVIQSTPANSVVPVRAYVSVSECNTKSKYTPVRIALENSDYRKTVLNNILIKLREFQRNYSDFEELSNVFKAIDDFADSLNI